MFISGSVSFFLVLNNFDLVMEIRMQLKGKTVENVREKETAKQKKKNIKGENTYKEKKGDKTLKALSFSCWGNKMSNSSFS